MSNEEVKELKYNAHISAGQLCRNIKHEGLSEKPFTLEAITKDNMIKVVFK